MLFWGKVRTNNKLGAKSFLLGLMVMVRLPCLLP